MIRQVNQAVLYELKHCHAPRLWRDATVEAREGEHAHAPSTQAATMALALSPWPDAGADRDEAIKRLAQAVGGRALHTLNITDADTAAAANALGEAASEMVEEYAPNAPQALKDEAVIRFAGISRTV